MKTEKNTLETEVERWSDPGEYPSGAGSGPRPSFDYVAGVAGEVVITLEWAELELYYDDPPEFIAGLAIDLPSGVTSCNFTHTLDGSTLTLTPADFEAGDIERERPEDR